MSQETVHLLVVEDNPGDVRLIEEALQIHGIRYRMTHCETAEDGVRTVNGYGEHSKDIPALLLLDFNLPAGEARDVLVAAGNNQVLKDMRKAVVTSSVAPRDRDAAFQFGADSFIFKPADLDTFLKEVGGAILKLINGDGLGVSGQTPANVR
ncbi:MAG: response regulator [Acidobacteriota bacterium]|nr:response regulator [Acidobacteriota bacterium]